MDSKKTAAAMLIVLAMCLVPVLSEGSQAADQPYVLTGEVPEYQYTGQDMVPSEMQTIEAAPGYSIVSVGLIGGDVVLAEGGVDEAPPFGLVPKPQHAVGIYRLVYETVVSDGTAESEWDVTAEWRIVPMVVDVSGYAEKVYDGSTAVRGGISITASGSTEITGITEITPLFADKHAGTHKDLRLRTVTDRMSNYEFRYGDEVCDVQDKYVLVPDAGSISPAPASFVGDPDREYDGTDRVTAEISVKDRVDPIKVGSARFLDPHAGTGLGIAVTTVDGVPTDYDFTFMGVSGEASGDTVVFEGVGSISQRSVTPIWRADDYYFYTGEVLEVPTAEASGAVAGETVPLRTECHPEGTVFRDVGEYTVKASIDGDHPDYVLTDRFGYFQIDPAPVKVTGSADREYDGTKAVTGVTVDGGAVVPDSVEFTDPMAGSGKDVVITFSDGYAANLMFSYSREDGTMGLGTVSDRGNTVLLTDYATILPREVTLEWTAPQVLVYTGYELEGPYVVATGLVGDDVLPLASATDRPFTDVGAYAFRAEAIDPNPNYSLPDETVEYTVMPAELDVLWTHEPMVYDGRERGFPAAEPLGMIGDDAVSLSTVLLGVNVFRDAGTYTFEAVPDNPNYTVNESSMLKVTIGKKPMTVSGTAHKVFDGTGSFGGVLTLDGTVDGIAVDSKMFADPGAGDGKDVVLGFTMGSASNYDISWDGTEGVPDGDNVRFAGIGAIEPRPIMSGDIGGTFVQTGDDLRLFVAVSSGTLVCDAFTWTSGGTDYTDTGMPVSGNGPIPVVVTADAGSDWTGTAEAVIDADAMYTVSVSSDGNGSVSGSSVTVARGTPVSSSGSRLTVGGTVFTATADSGYIFGSWSGVPAEGRVVSDVTVTAGFDEYVPPTPPPVYIRSVEVTTPPDRVEYVQGDSFDPAGMKVVVNYSDWTSYAVTDYTWSPEVLVRGGPAEEVVISYRGESASVFVKVEGAVPIPPVPIVHPEVDIPVEGDTMTDAEAAEAADRIDAVREYDPGLEPIVTVHTDTSETFTVPVSLYESVRENGASLEVRTVTGSVAMSPGSLSELVLPEDGDLTVGVVSEGSDVRAYRISLSSEAGEIPVEFGEPAEVVLGYPADGFGDDMRVYLVSGDERTEVTGVTYSEVADQAFLAFPITETGLYTVEKETPSDNVFGWAALVFFLLLVAAFFIIVYLSVRLD